VDALHVEPPVPERHRGVQLGEQHLGAGTGQPAGTMGDVGVQEISDPWPDGRERALPIRLQRVREPGQLVPRAGAPGFGDPRSRVLAAEELHVGTDLLRRRSTQRVEVAGDIADRTRRRRRQEVRLVAPRRDQRHGGLEREPVEPAIERPQPRHVERGRGRVAQREQRPHELPDRGHREPGARKILDGEDEADHRPDATSSRP
jgi:hypothetical protein